MSEKLLLREFGSSASSRWPLVNAFVLLSGGLLVFRAYANTERIAFAAICAAIMLTGVIALGAYISGAHASKFELLSPPATAAAIFVWYFFVVFAGSDRILDVTLWYVLGSLITAGIVAFTAIAIYRPALLQTTRVTRRSVTSYLVAQALGILLFVLLAKMGGFGSPLATFSNPLKFRAFLSGGGVTYFKLLADFLILMPVRMIALSDVRRLPWFLAGSLGVALAYTLATGSRGATVFLLLDLLLIAHLRRIRISILTVLFVVLVCIPFIVIYGEYRVAAQFSRGNNDKIIRFVENMKFQDISRLTLRRIDAPFYFNLLMGSSGADDRQNWGASYLLLPLQVVPRSMWPGKPYMPNSELSARFVQSDMKVTFDFSIFGETFLGFGRAGWLVAGIIVAVCVVYSFSVYEIAYRTRAPAAILLAVSLWYAPAFVIIAGAVPAMIYVATQLAFFYAARSIFLSKEPGP